MILVDSSVWINYFNGIPMWQTNLLDNYLSNIPVIIGDLILAEVLRGFKSNKDYENIDGEKLIIIDEAHKYRNELTKDYDDLKKLCSDNKVLLLTATPFNNKPQDIFAMIRLFQIPAKSTIRTVDNLAKRFKELIIGKEFRIEERDFNEFLNKVKTK